MSQPRKSQVLIVDDYIANISYLTDVLKAIEDLEVTEAQSGEEALQILNTKRFDLILLDINMPKMDGFEVCKAIKADKATDEIPVIFLTALNNNNDIIKGFDAGAVDYIAKPFSVQELLSRVQTHLKLRHKSDQMAEINRYLEDKITERTMQLLETNKDLNTTNIKLTRAYKQLSTLDKAKNSFIALINHELRTPLNGILGYTSLLEGMNIDEEAKEYVESINHLVSRLVKLAEISLIFTELETVDHTVTTEKLALKQIFLLCIEYLEIEAKKLKLEIHDLDDSIFILGEKRLLQACFSIIIDNAIKYSPQGGTIDISVSQDENFSVIDISDEGPGFSKEAQSKLFKLFSADNLSYKEFGFGIGLATAKRITDLIDARLTVRNNDNRGATVSIQFPKCLD